MHNFVGTSLERSGRLRLGAALFFLAAFVVLGGLSGCKDVTGDKNEYAYVASPEAVLRDRVAAVYGKTGVIHNGERVQILEHMQNKRFVRVRSAQGLEGWVQERYLTDQQTYDQLQQLAEKFKNVPAQAVAATRAQVNLHAIPGRKTEHLYQLNENEKVDMLERQMADKNALPPAPPKPEKPDKADKKDKRSNDAKKVEKETDTEPATGDEEASAKPGQPPVMEDWWLVRDQQKRVGWVLGRMLYVDAPIEIATYAEGQRIVAFFVLDQVQDEGKQVPEYLTLLCENKDGLPYDFDQVRVFTWNSRRHRYETAYRERNLFGVLPLTMGRENFGKEGELRTFTIQVRDDAGATHEQKYKFNPPIVRRVLGPGEELPVRHKRRR
jgi:SH3-like domain-containing protein